MFAILYAKMVVSVAEGLFNLSASKIIKNLFISNKKKISIL